MDLREVYDWRYREDHWKRRCRIVGGDISADRIECSSQTSIGTASHFSRMGYRGVGHQRCLSTSSPTRRGIGDYLKLDEEGMQLR